MEVKLNTSRLYAVHEVVGDIVEILQKLSTFYLRHAVPNLLEDELMTVGDNPADKGDVKERNVIFCV
jgi:hypothetical protein